MNINIYFDFDMTLGYRIMMWRDTVRELLLEEGVVADAGGIRSFSDGKGYPWSLPSLTHEEFFGGKDWWKNTEEFIYEGLLPLVDKERAQRVSKKFRARYTDMEYWGVFPDTVPLLKRLKVKGYKLYILSNHVPEATDIINNLGIGQYFDKIFISADMGVEKPHPLIYKKALEHTGAEDINIMIGDNFDADISGALSSGFQYAVMVRKENTSDYPYYSRYFEGLDEIIERFVSENR